MKLGINVITVAVFAFVVSSHALAEARTDTRDQRGKTVTDSNASTTAVPGTRADSSKVFLNAGAGLALLNGNTGWGIQLGGITEAAAGSPLYVGVDLGLNFWSFTSLTRNDSSGATGIQLLPTAIYRFTMAGTGNFYPYLGASLGPNIYISRATIGGVSVSDTSVYFEFLVRPGVYLGLSKAVALNIEPKFGILRSDFIFLPQVSAVFPL